MGPTEVQMFGQKSKDQSFLNAISVVKWYVTMYHKFNLAINYVWCFCTRDEGLLRIVLVQKIPETFKYSASRTHTCLLSCDYTRVFVTGKITKGHVIFLVENEFLI